MGCLGEQLGHAFVVDVSPSLGGLKVAVVDKKNSTKKTKTRERVTQKKKLPGNAFRPLGADFRAKLNRAQEIHRFSSIARVCLAWCSAP